jgi:hypothetical protein
MASKKYFMVQKDTALPRLVREVPVPGGGVRQETEHLAVSKGDAVTSDQLHPDFLESLEDGDEHKNSLLKECSEDDWKEANAGVVVAYQPDHATDAHLLAQDGFKVLSQEQVLEMKGLTTEAYAKAMEESLEALEHTKHREGGEDVSPTDRAAAQGEVEWDEGKGVHPYEVAEKADFKGGEDVPMADWKESTYETVPNDAKSAADGEGGDSSDGGSAKARRSRRSSKQAAAPTTDPGKGDK